MREDFYNKMYAKYHNNIIRNLPELLTEFLHKNPNYITLLDNKFITLDEILYWLKNKPYKNRKELLELVLIYVEMKHGIFDRAKRYAKASSHNK